MMAVGCARIEPEIPENPRDVVQEEILISKSFLAGVAETRTTLEGVTVLFSKGESISIWDGLGNREYKADEAGSSVSFSGQVSASASEFFALSPFSASTVFSKSGTTVTAKTVVPSTQEATVGSFAVGANISAAQSTSEDSFSLENVLSVAKFTLASANLSGHQIVSIELSSSYPLAGDVVVTYGVKPVATAGSNTVNTILLSHTDGSSLADGTYYLTLLPNAGGQITLKFTAADGYIATKTATLKSAFEAGSIKNLGTVKNLSWEGPKYVKVTSAPADWTGDYLLVYESDSKILSSISSKNIGETLDVSFNSDNTISWEDYKAYNIAIAKSGDGYTLDLNNSGYLGWSSGNSLTCTLAESVTDYFRWTLSLDSKGNVLISNLKESGRTIWYNPSSPRFCAYTQLGDYVKDVQIYKKETGAGGDTDGPTVALSTESATEITDATAVLNATFNGLSPINVQEVGFYWGTDASNLTGTVYDNSAFTTSSGSISATLTSLSANTTYYYQATMMVWDETNRTYVEFKGAVKSFKTTASSSSNLGEKGWLELPSITGSEFYAGSFYSNGTSGKNRNYSYDYEYSWYSSMWVAYPLYSSTMGNGSLSKWSNNPNFDTTYQVNCWDASYNVLYGQTEYIENAAGTGKEYYARGHQIPNADRNGNSIMQSQTYIATNSTPQIQNQFNSSLWGALESAVRTVAKTDTVYVVTGPIFQKVGETRSITYIHPKGDPTKDVPVPNYYWKALLKVKWSGETVVSASAIGFWYEHKPYKNGENYDDDEFIVSVSTIEQWTGLDLFANLPASLEEQAKNNSNWNTFFNF